MEQLANNEMELNASKSTLDAHIDNLDNTLAKNEERYCTCKQQRDHFKNEYNKTILNLQNLEVELENEKLQRHNDKESLLAHISQLKRTCTDSEVAHEKHVYMQMSNDNNLKDALSRNQQLELTIKELEQDKLEAKEKLIETVKQWQHKLKVIDEEKSIELIEIEASLEAIEETRGQDLPLLKMKLEEIEGLKSKQAELTSHLRKKCSETDTLKEEIAKLESNLKQIELEQQDSRNGENSYNGIPKSSPLIIQLTILSPSISSSAYESIVPHLG